MYLFSKLNRRFPVGLAHGYVAVVNCQKPNTTLRDGRFCKSKANLIEESVMKRKTSLFMLVVLFPSMILTSALALA